MQAYIEEGKIASEVQFKGLEYSVPRTSIAARSEVVSNESSNMITVHTQKVIVLQANEARPLS